MIRATVVVAIILILSCFVSAQTYSNCKELANGYKVEWTADETNDKLSARFTVPNSSGYAAVGLKSTSSGMNGATILIGSKSTITGEFYATSNAEPTKLSSNFYTSATSSFNGTTTYLTLVRSLKRPGTAPATYYEISKGSNMDLLLAAHSSSAYPTTHTSTYKTSFNFFTASTCSSTGGGGNTNNVESVLNNQSIMMIALIVLSVVSFLLF